MRNTASGGREYFTYNKDVRGSTSSIVDSQGTAQAIYYYDDFGNTTAKGNFQNEICYTGGIYDDTTGLYYLNARYYSPEDGNFMSQDTYRGEYTNPSTLNFYGYCGGNPINYVDPSGHFAISIVVFGKLIIATGIVGVIYQNRKSIERGFKALAHSISNRYRRETLRSKTLIHSFVSAYIKSITKVRVRPKYRSSYENHHIVAKKAHRVKKSKEYLRKVGIGINSYRNIVRIKTGLHRRLHTKAYYEYVNLMVGTTYKANKYNRPSVRKSAMEGTLQRIKKLLSLLSEKSPF